MKILETKYLNLHEFQRTDALSLLDVMNQPGYHRYYYGSAKMRISL